MSHSDSEEQFQEIKEFLASKGKIIIAIIVIGLLSIWGWQYWQSNKEQQAIDSSDTYEKLIEQLDDNNLSSVTQLVDFAKDNDTIYSVFANLRAAQFYVENLQDYAGAKTLLENAAKKTDSAPVLAMINIRIARLQNQLAQYSDSLKTLDKVTDTSWSAVVNDIRGDVYINLDRYQDAINAYLTALSSTPTPELESNIQMKLNQSEYLNKKYALEQANIAEEQAKQTAIEQNTQSDATESQQ